MRDTSSGHTGTVAGRETDSEPELTAGSLTGNVVRALRVRDVSRKARWPASGTTTTLVTRLLSAQRRQELVEDDGVGQEAGFDSGRADD